MLSLDLMKYKDIITSFQNSLSEEVRSGLLKHRLDDTDRLEIRMNKRGNFSMRTIHENGCSGSYRAGATLYSLPESHKNFSTELWTVATTDFNVLTLLQMWPIEKMIFDDESRIVFDYLLTRYLQQIVQLHKKSQIKGSLAFRDCKEFPLMPYQRIALEGIINQESSALFMEQGTGKTPIAIARICNECGDTMSRILIVCPKNVRENWLKEFKKFSTLPGKSVVLRGDELNRIKLIIEMMKEEDRWSATICSYDIVGQTWMAMSMINWDLVILDESHFIKSPSTKRYRNILQLRDRSKSRMILTGTPVTNILFDLYAQFEFLGKGLSGFGSFKAFKNYYGKFNRNSKYSKLVDYQNVPMIKERLARLSYIISKEEALPDLPPKVYDIVEVEMTAEQKKFYKTLRDQLILEIEHDLEHVLTATNMFVKLLRLSQITSGFITWDTDDDTRNITLINPNPKLDMLMSLLKEKNQNEKTIIWACWVVDLRMIDAKLTEHNIDHTLYYGSTSDKDREIAVNRFNNDKNCKIFIGNPVTAGVGLNLLGHSNGECDVTHVIYYSQNWSMVARAQSEDRCHRKGTRKSVRYTDLCVLRTIDEEIRTRVVEQRITATEVQDIRDVLKRLSESLGD